MNAQTIALACATVFGDAVWATLKPNERAAIIDDVDAICTEEEWEEALCGFVDAAATLRQRIGGAGALQGYARVLLVARKDGAN